MTGLQSDVGMVLGGGELLLQPLGVQVVRVALASYGRACQRDGYGGLPAPARALAALLEAAATAAPLSVRTAGSGSPEVPSEDDRALSALLDPIGVQEVAKMLDCTPRNARDLCARGVFPSARPVGGRWLLERADVVARQAAA